MKKIVAIIIAVLLIISTLFGCTENNSTVSDKTSVPEATTGADETIEPTYTAAPVNIPYFTAVEGYYVNETRKSLVSNIEYVNVFGTKSYYTTPETETYLPLDGKPEDWEISEDKYELVDTLSVIDGLLILKTIKAVPVTSAVTGEVTDIKKGTGYLYLTNKSTQEIVKVYVNMPVEQTEERKQTDPSIKYYLYFEKGSYAKFVAETCCLTCYVVDEDGYYTVPYFTVTSACGATIDKTPVGIHTLGTREEWHSWGGSAYGQFCTNYASGVYLHSPTTTDGMTQRSVGVGSYNQVGTHASGGCLRMQTGSAYWFYTNCPAGTKLEIVANNPRGTRIEVPASLKGNSTYDPTDPILLTGPIVTPEPTATPETLVSGVPLYNYEKIGYGVVDFNDNEAGKSLNDPSITSSTNKLRNDWTPSRGLPDAINNAIWTDMGDGNIAVKMTASEFITCDKALGDYGDMIYVTVDLKCEKLGSFCGLMLDMATDYEDFSASTSRLTSTDGQILHTCYGFTLTDNNTMRIFVRKNGRMAYYDFDMGIDASSDFHTYHVFRSADEKRAYFCVDFKLIGYIDFDEETDKIGIYDKNNTFLVKTEVAWKNGNVMFASIGSDQTVYMDNIAIYCNK